MTEARIRPGRPEDAAAILAMVRAIPESLGKDGGVVRSTPEAIRRWGFGSGALFSTLIAERDAESGPRPVGLSLFFPTYSTWRGAPGVYLQDLYVDPDERGGGLGRRLLAATAAAGRAWEADHLILAVDLANPARAFYGRLGFAAMDDEMTMRLAGDAFAAFAAVETRQNA